jgi:signal transduction histidine kinase
MSGSGLAAGSDGGPPGIWPTRRDEPASIGATDDRAVPNESKGGPDTEGRAMTLEAGATADTALTPEPASGSVEGEQASPVPMGGDALLRDGDDARLLRRTRIRLVMWSGGITLAVLLLLGATLFAAVRATLEGDSVAQLRDRADAIGRMLGQLPANADVSGSPELRTAQFGSVTVPVIVGPDGAVYAARSIAGAVATLGLPVEAGVTAARVSGSIDVRSTTVGGVPVRVLSEPVTRDGATFVVQVVGDRTVESQTLASLLFVLGIGGFLALAFAVGGGWLYAERALVPIRESLRRQRAFAADASHELRTPLAVIRGNLEYLERHPDARVAELQPAMDDMTAEVDELTRLVDDLLLLARADSGVIEMAREPLDLADVATTALGALAPVAEARSVRLTLDAQPASVVGDPGRLRQVVTILVDNAIRHSPPGGEVFVGVAPVGKEALLRVDDEGPGIREEDRAHLFERFWRASDAPTGGVGLGLSIAAWLVGRHHGSIDGASRPDGRGARFEVRLPLAT